jgi:alanine racemase
LVVVEAISRPAWAEIDLDALAANVRLVRDVSAPAAVCAVVKADGYGHGAVTVAKAALEAGAAWLAVALVDEGIELRRAGIGAPILVLSEPPTDTAEAALEHTLTPTLYSQGGLAAFERAAAILGRPAKVHVKVDTGMHRVGLAPDQVVGFIGALKKASHLTFEGFWTHLAVADGDGAEDREFTELQLSRLDGHLADIEAQGVRPALRHAANSAGAIAYPRARLDLVRTGIALYGELPRPSMAGALASASDDRSLEPVLSLKARVVALRRLDAGERPSYGRARPLPTTSTVATVPIGYADGVTRRLLDSGAEVLIGGRRRPLAGAVTMDQILVDCGPDDDVSLGDEVVLIGRQGGESIDAAEWAQRLGTISYEVLTGIGPRVPRVTRTAGGPRWRHGLATTANPSARA